MQLSNKLYLLDGTYPVDSAIHLLCNRDLEVIDCMTVNHWKIKQQLLTNCAVLAVISLDATTISSNLPCPCTTLSAESLQYTTSNQYMKNAYDRQAARLFLLYISMHREHNIIHIARTRSTTGNPSKTCMHTNIFLFIINSLSRNGWAACDWAPCRTVLYHR